ncbi:dienelactone hydrolase family protein [Paraburkholderia tropica]|uniref:dienelactone hydrolase family protein n=1 Tax=Paraburkholderia tropica TaxID=92647 RepID=UPI0015929F14|nr:alpha/beta family hydrolase [Paraburkholderia tropica]
MEMQDVQIPVDHVALGGLLEIPTHARGVVVFAHGSGSSRFSPRNRQVAADLHGAGFATLLFDLLSAEEQLHDGDGTYRFNISLLARRLAATLVWLRESPDFASLPLGLFGASTGAAAALVAAAQTGWVKAIVCRGGRPDLAGTALASVKAPTLLIVGGLDEDVLRLNRKAAKQMTGEHRIEIVRGATHLFEEPGALDEVTCLANEWFERWLGACEPN